MLWRSQNSLWLYPVRYSATTTYCSTNSQLCHPMCVDCLTHHPLLHFAQWFAYFAGFVGFEAICPPAVLAGPARLVCVLGCCALRERLGILQLRARSGRVTASPPHAADSFGINAGCGTARRTACSRHCGIASNDCTGCGSSDSRQGRAAGHRLACRLRLGANIECYASSGGPRCACARTISDR